MTELQAELRGRAETGEGRSHKAHWDIWGKIEKCMGTFIISYQL